MDYPQKLVLATWLVRRKRFLLDASLDGSKEFVTAHCPNTGSMLGVNQPGSPCLLLPSTNSKRKCRYTIEAVRVNNVWVGVHPARANTVAKEAMEAGMIDEVSDFESIRAEVPYRSSSRADFMVLSRNSPPCMVEVKSASLAENGVAMFPDAITARGFKHLNELARVVQQGNRALMLFVATRNDVSVFRAAARIDPAYAKRLREVADEGVAVRAITSFVSEDRMIAVRQIPIDLG